MTADADPWGRDDPPAVAPDTLPPLPDSLSLDALRRARPARFARPEALPEVAALMAHGWEPLEDAPLYWNAPAVWPREHRCWVADRLPHVSIGHLSDGSVTVEPWDDETSGELAADRAEAAREGGLEAPPPGRLWLLRSPWPSLPLDVVLVLAHRRGQDRGLWSPRDELTAGARDLFALAEEQVWDWWAPDADHPARRWRAAGRTGRDVARLLLLDVGPDDLARLTAPSGAGLTEEQATRWCEAVGETGPEAVRRVLAWRGLGLPAEPPAHLMLLVEDPAEVEPWLAAGFAVTDAERLAPFGLALANRWRAAGFDAATTAGLLAADPVVTPQEAAAFTAAGLDDPVRTGWLEAGFDAPAAAAWTAAGVLANEARVWRAEGLAPADAAPHRPEDPDEPFLPPRAAVGWFSWGTDARAARSYGVTDPPGTRGRLAAGRDGHDWS
jgi:hypothetical protein